ncbi:hypothetical protein [Mycobacterium sp.]|uniref:hypothetical protein n=1 Tax=Mycobacterium sp. TaxID=1785 RepID=UPI002BE505AD|nr:hypothetical protein [Mycobacterium sp.]HKP41176.1 hypothetical protein [Mycobacterium sp.]
MTTPTPDPVVTPQLLPTPPDPLPGLTRLRRRLGDRLALRDDLLARLAGMPDAGRPGRTFSESLDVAGDPTLLQVAGLWARVADSVCAYAEMTAGEAYLGTAQDWTDLRRVVELVGYRPGQRTAAHGWIRTETAPGAAPKLPAGTPVQAPGTSTHTAQTYEVAADTQLRAEWAQLTITGVPVPTAPAGKQLRFLADPGFIASDRVVFVSEGGAPTFPTIWDLWLEWWLVLSGSSYVGLTGQAVRGVARVTKRADDLGAALLTFDRPLNKLLPQTTGVSYAAYRVRTELRLPARLDKISYVDSTGAPKTADAPYPSGEATAPYNQNWVYVDDASEASVGQYILLYAGSDSQCLVTTIKAITATDWHVAPGTVRRVAKIDLTDPLPNALVTAGLTVLLTDSRQVAQHYELPPLVPGDAVARIHPRLDPLPSRLAIQTTATDGTTGWELSGCATNASDTTADPGGQLISLADTRQGKADRGTGSGAATGNLAPIQHGTTHTGPLTPVGSTAVISGPVTGDVSADGTVTDSLSISVAGERFDEVPTLYGRGPGEPVYTTRLAADGRLAATFGDGVNGMLPRGNITASWRVGGGLVGELDGAEITTLSAAINGVRKIAGVGPTGGAADQEDPLRMRRAAAARIRALDRAVALQDLADLALTLPGTSHSTAWRGAGPPGCPCGRSGLHVAVLRSAGTGVRAPIPAELHALSNYLDARRDTRVPLCICAARPSAITVTAAFAVDPRRDPGTVCAAVSAALLDPNGPLAPLPRDLAIPLDGSDVIEVAQPVTGIIGVATLNLTGAATTPTTGDLSLGRLPALPYELLYVATTALSGTSS